jgi:hypothetical protein
MEILVAASAVMNFKATVQSFGDLGILGLARTARAADRGGQHRRKSCRPNANCSGDFFDCELTILIRSEKLVNTPAYLTISVHVGDFTTYAISEVAPSQVGQAGPQFVSEISWVPNREASKCPRFQKVCVSSGETSHCYSRDKNKAWAKLTTRIEPGG